jgi:gamma-glutamyltranspeptidase/glutathione hydrolase
MRRFIPLSRLSVVLAASLLTTGCTSTLSLFGGGTAAPPTLGTPGYVRGFAGAVVADEPQAALVGKSILSAGGNAADAAVAVGLALAVTLPSRAGLGSGGACLALKGDDKAPGIPDAIMFLPRAPGGAAVADRPAAVPMLARGLFLLYARHGRLPRFETLMQPAERLAREGTPASRALVRDLGVVGAALAADPAAGATFFPGGRPVAEGEMLRQPDLAGTLGEIHRGGVGALYQGPLAHRLVAAADRAGGGLTAADLRAALPEMMPALTLEAPGEATVSFLPLPADGGLATAAAYQVLAADPSAFDQARARAIAAAAQFRRAGGTAEAILAARPGGLTLPALPASTTFATLDKDGNAVVCAVTMGNLFGTGRMAPGTGVVLGASPAWMPPPLLSAAMVSYRRSSGLGVAVGGSGQEGTPVAAAAALIRALADKGKVASVAPGAAPDPGRANVIACTRPPKDSPGSCAWATDPRGFGLAVGSGG